MASILEQQEEQIKQEAPVAKPMGSEEVFTPKNTITIRDKKFKIELLPSEEGLELWEYLMKKLLPSVGTGLDSMQHDSVMDGSPKTFSQAFGLLAEKLSGKDLKEISKNLFQGATVDGKPLDFNEQFKGNYGSWKSLLTFALKENFGSFFEEGWGDSLTGLVSLVVPQSQGSQE